MQDFYKNKWPRGDLNPRHPRSSKFRLAILVSFEPADLFFSKEKFALRAWYSNRAELRGLF